MEENQNIEQNQKVPYRPFTPGMDRRTRDKFESILKKILPLNSSWVTHDTFIDTVCFKRNELHYNPYWIEDTDIETLESAVAQCAKQYNASCAARAKAWELLHDAAAE